MGISLGNESFTEAGKEKRGRAASWMKMEAGMHQNEIKVERKGAVRTLIPSLF